MEPPSTTWVGGWTLAVGGWVEHLPEDGCSAADLLLIGCRAICQLLADLIIGQVSAVANHLAHGGLESSLDLPREKVRPVIF